MMQPLEIKSITAISFSCQTTLADLNKYVRVKARELYQSALTNKMEITGPVYWIYHGMDGKPETLFTLEICLPVRVSEYNDDCFEIVELPVFRCLSVTHYGSWTEMFHTYNLIINQALNQGFRLSGTCREVYVNMDFDNVENNITWIQIGIH